MPKTLKCPSCAAPLEYDGRSPSIQCDYCNNIVLMPEESRRSGSTSQSYTFRSDDPFANFGPQVNLDRIVEINDLIHRGRKIEAIKLFRNTFDVGLKEAKEAVERLERGEAINLAGQQRITAFHEADVQNQSYGTMNQGEMVINVGAGSVRREKPGCVGAFIGQFGCLLFLFFWVAFLIAMVVPLIYPDVVLYGAPILCDEGYQEAVAERVGYYRTDDFEGENVVLLNCIYEAGSEETVHPMKVLGLLFGAPMAVLAVLAFGIVMLGRISAVLSPD